MFDKRSVLGYFVFVISCCYFDSIGVMDNYLFDFFIMQVIFVIIVKVDYVFWGDFQNVGCQGVYEFMVV